MILLLDNDDSFTINLWQYCCELGAHTQVLRASRVDLKTIQLLAPDKIILSPGPGHPKQAPICTQVIAHFAEHIPILGVCLGHQSIAHYFNAGIDVLDYPMHGKTSMIYHQQSGLFTGLTNPFRATRYHSLCLNKQSLPDCLTVTAWTKNDGGEVNDIMAIQHQHLPLYGVQFHPESIMTELGHHLLNNFLQI